MKLVFFFFFSTWLVFLPAQFALLKRFILFVIRFIIRDPIMTRIVRSIYVKKTNEFFAYRYKLQKFNEQFEKKIWQGLDLDVILCPVQAIPAITHHGCNTLSPLAAATVLYNVRKREKKEGKRKPCCFSSRLETYPLLKSPFLDPFLDCRHTCHHFTNHIRRCQSRFSPSSYTKLSQMEQDKGFCND